MKVISNFLKQLKENFFCYIQNKLLRTPKIWGDKTNLIVGKNVGLNNTFFNLASGKIIIEDFVSFGFNVCLLTGTHDYSKKNEHRLAAVPSDGRDIIIKKGAWIATNATICGGVTIGENAVIGANSLVLKDVPPNCLYAGTPAKLIKEI